MKTEIMIDSARWWDSLPWWKKAFYWVFMFDVAAHCSACKAALKKYPPQN